MPYYALAWELTEEKENTKKMSGDLRIEKNLDQYGTIISDSSCKTNDSGATNPIFQSPDKINTNNSDKEIKEALTGKLITQYELTKANKILSETSKNELLSLSFDKICEIEKTIKSLKGKTLSEEDIDKILDKLVKKITEIDNKFLSETMEKYKDNPDDLSNILNGKVKFSTDKQEVLKYKIDKFCKENSISPKLSEKLKLAVTNLSKNELENLKNKIKEGNSILRQEQKNKILSNLTYEISFENTERLTKEKLRFETKINSISFALSEKEKVQLVEEMNARKNIFLSDLHSTQKYTGEKREHAIKEASSKFFQSKNISMQNLSEHYCKSDIAGKTGQEARDNIDKFGQMYRNLSIAEDEYILENLNETEKTIYLQTSSENAPVMQEKMIEGVEKAFDEIPTDTEVVKATFDTIANETKETLKSTVDLAKKANLAEKTIEILQKNTEKIEKQIDKKKEELLEKFWESDAGKRCIEYSKQFVEYRRQEATRRMKEVYTLEKKCEEQQIKTEKIRKEAIVKKEKADSVKKEVDAKQLEIKKKLKISSDFKMTDAMLKNIDFGLAVKKKHSDIEYTKARKDLINAESDLRLANYFLEWSQKMASIEKTLANVYSHFLGI